MSGGGDLLIFSSDQLRLASPGFDSAGDTLDAAMTTLQSALAAEQGCWGSDEPGTTFAEKYLPAAAAAHTRFADLVTALHGVRTALDQAAHTFDQTEAGNTGALGGGR